MSDEKLSRAENIARSVEKISDSKGLEAIGHGLGWGIAALAAALMFAGMPAAMKWDGHLHAQAQCFDVKEVAGKVIKINTCTGEAQELAATKNEQK